MADISQELEQIRNARYGDDIRTAIANALEAINKNMSCTDELASLKETLNRLSEAIDKGAAENASEEEVQVLKAYVDNISDTLNEGESGYIPTRSLELKAITRDGNGEDSFTSSDYVTRNELNTIRGQINSELNLKATQYDFDYIVGNGFQDWTITDYIIRLREDYNTALSEMSTRTESQAAISQGIARLKKLIAINDSITSDTKVTFTSTSTEIELATMDDIDESFNRLDSYFTFEWKGAWESGGVDSHGWKTDNVKQLRSADLLLSRDFKATLNSLYSLRVVRYNASKTMINAGSWITGSNNITYFDDDVPNTRYIRLLIKKNDDSDLTNPLLPADIFSITMKGTDWTGENDNTAIDAHLVNELRDDIDKIVEVSETQPTSRLNEIWVLPDSTETQVPTMADFTQMEEDYAENFAPTYDPESPYAVGDLVTHDNKVYRCKTAILSGETWDSAHWDQTSMSDELSGMGDEVSDLRGALDEAVDEFSGGLTPEIKVALLNCFEKVGWIDDNGQSYYDALEAALYADNIDHIEAVLSLGTHQVIMGDDLDSLRDYLTVTVYYKDETQEVVTNYELSGDVSTEGTKTITVTVGRKTTTFTVPVVWGYRFTPQDDLSQGTLVYAYRNRQTVHYTDPLNTIRVCNLSFLPWETGYNCYVEIDTALNVVASVNCFNQTAMNSVNNHQDINSNNVGLPGWASSNPSLSVIPDSINNSPTKAIRVAFKTVPTETEFSVNDISEVRITRRAK